MDNEKKTIKIAIMGAGTVGGGVYKVLQMRKNDMYQRAGTDIQIKKDKDAIDEKALEFQVRLVLGFVFQAL